MTVSRSGRYVLAFVLGCVMFAVSFRGAYDLTRQHFLFDKQRIETVRLLNALHAAILEYQATNQRWPENLDEIDVDLDRFPFVRDARERGERGFVDAWGWPLQYRHQEHSFELYSLGRNGKENPGEQGVDAGIDSSESLEYQAAPTLRQFAFAFDSHTAVLWIDCAAAGILTFVLCLRSTRPVGTAEPARVSIRALVGVVIATWCVGFFLTYVHVQPFGH